MTQIMEKQRITDLLRGLSTFVLILRYSIPQCPVSTQIWPIQLKFKRSVGKYGIILDISSVSHHRMSQYLPRLLTCDRSDSLVI